MRSPTLGAGALALMLSACGGSSNSSDAFARATPDVSGLVLETAPGANDGSAFVAGATLGGDDLALVGAATTPVPGCQPWQYACKIREGVRNFNLYVRTVIGPVEALATTTPTVVSDDTRVYGPLDVPEIGPVATVRLTVKRGPADRYRWKLEGKPVQTDDSHYAAVMAGWLRPGDQPHRGAGVLAIDLSNLSALNHSGVPVDGFKGAGQILAAFKHLGQAKSLSFVVKGFIPDTTIAGAQPIDAAFVGHKTPSGETGVRLASVDELLAPAFGSDTGRELLLGRGRWVPGLGGRTAVVLTDVGNGNDVASYSNQAFQVDFLLGTSCWDRVDSGTEHEVFHGLFACRAVGVPRCIAVTPPAAWVQAGFIAAAQDVSACRPGTEVGDESNPPDTSASNRNPEPGGAGMMNGTSMAPDVNAMPSSLDEVRF